MIPEPKLNIWEHSQGLRELCRQRGLDLLPEMDCSAQGAALVGAHASVGPDQARSGSLRLLDVGCGGGHFFHSLRRRHLLVDYYGLDYSPSMVQIAREALGGFNLAPEKIMLNDVRALTDFACDLVVMINTLSFNADFREPLERLAATGARAIIIRDFFGPRTVIKWERDGFLDPGYNHLQGYWNEWSRDEVSEFLSNLGYQVGFVIDERTRGQVEMVVNKPYRWSWLVAEKKEFPG